MIRTSIAVIALGALGGCATLATDPPTCPSEAQAAEFVRLYVARQPNALPPDTMTMEGAMCGRDKVTRLFVEPYGRVVGYKAGLTNPAVQKRFNYAQPVRGTLFERMLVPDNAEVPAGFGARPVFEADLVVEVKSAAIVDATTPLQALEHIAAIYPFIELPDLTFTDPAKITGPALVYANVGARLGVLGAPIPVRPSPSLADALRDMTVRLVDGTGKELDSGKGSAILEHPLNAAIWLVADLKRAGIIVKPGDLLSLGSFSRLMPPQAGMTVRAVYEGLPGNPSVTVRFR
jgi:2-keto-4-pentenoate hydratase